MIIQRVQFRNIFNVIWVWSATVFGCGCAQSVAPAIVEDASVRTIPTGTSWGLGTNGQLGRRLPDDGAFARDPVPQAVANIDHITKVEAGSSHVCALRDNSEVLCWGRNSNGQLGDRTRIDRFAPVLVNWL